jgi:hypothetical protein
MTMGAMSTHTMIADFEVEALRIPAAKDEELTPNTPMKSSYQLNLFAGLWTLAALASVGSLMPLDIFAAQQAGAQRTFASPDEAIKALGEATKTQDKGALHEIFGPEFDQLLTGDAVQDAKNAEKFAAAVAQSCKPVPEGEDKVMLEVGTNEWPMPIPLVKADGQWHFDTAAGKEEVVARHIGKDELHAIGVCRAYVKEQQQYASSNGGAYTEKFTRPQPFHGYYFRILKRQGPDAPGGKKNYVSQGNLSGGFALVAYPEHWDQSGIMTFIVGQDGNVYEQNLGDKTSRIARRMKEYNPDTNWKLVQDEGIANAASEKTTP